LNQFSGSRKGIPGLEEQIEPSQFSKGAVSAEKSVVRAVKLPSEAEIDFKQPGSSPLYLHFFLP